MEDFVSDVLGLGLGDVHTWFEACLSIGPYLNEIANLLTLTVLVPLTGFELYPHSPATIAQSFLKGSIDMIALFSTVAIVALYSQKYNSTAGIVKGTALILFSFLIPNLFMDRILGMVGDNKAVQLAVGIVFIYLMDVLVNLCTYLYRRMSKPKQKH